jgi:hypothetical protein
MKRKKSKNRLYEKVKYKYKYNLIPYFYSSERVTLPLWEAQHSGDRRITATATNSSFHHQTPIVMQSQCLSGTEVQPKLQVSSRIESDDSSLCC